MNAAMSDSAFLERAFAPAPRPVECVAPVRRLLFSPGMGLGLGDQFMCVALVQALRKRYTDAAIDLLTDYPEFWQGRAPRGVAVVARARDDAEGVLRLLDTRYDLAVLGYHPGCLARLASCARPTVFCAGGNLSAYRSFVAGGGTCLEIPLDSVREAVYEGDKFLALFHDFGVTDRFTVNELSRSGSWPAPAKLLLPRMGVATARILIHPGAAKPYKRWPLPGWIGLARLLERAGAHVAVSSGNGPDEAAAARQLEAAVRGLQAHPVMGLEAYLALWASYDMVLSADTFVPHAAAAMGRPISVAVYGPTDPIRYCPRGRHNFFVGSRETGPAAFFDAVETVFSLCGGDIEALARPGQARHLAHNAKGLRVLLEQLAQKPSDPLRFSIEARLTALWASLRERGRPVLAGSEEMVFRLRHSLASEPLERLVRILDQTPALRTARLLASDSATARAAHAHLAPQDHWTERTSSYAQPL